MSGGRIFEKIIELEIGFLFRGPGHLSKGLTKSKMRYLVIFTLKISFFRQQKINEIVVRFSVNPGRLKTDWSLWSLFFIEDVLRIQ